MFSSRRRLKETAAYVGDAYVTGRVFWFVWRWQVSDRLGGDGGLAFGRLLAKNAARDSLRRRRTNELSSA